MIQTLFHKVSCPLLKSVSSKIDTENLKEIIHQVILMIKMKLPMLHQYKAHMQVEKLEQHYKAAKDY